MILVIGESWVVIVKKLKNSGYLKKNFQKKQNLRNAFN